ncbi:hypothetical protein [Metabacillus fastidiosus]|uniref:hypothetical protein n=1 Tax=Metabacillus fastidiosus TaxID=1458 RepID=UPI002DBF7ADA|nr:hypothetical protein [Metabacillus fastidiosus]MEC2076392.1 hypothetical protein [Metabacillus fastidiosus]
MNGEMLQIGLEEAVMEKGTEGMIKQFNDKKELSKKKKGSIDSRYTKILKELYECNWESVEISGSGADRVITCVRRKEVPTERADGRADNGEGQLPYKEDIREAALIQINKTNKITTTYRHLLREMNIVDEVLHVASRKFTIESQKAFYDNLDDKYKTHGYSIFWEVVRIEYRRLIDNLKSALRSLADSKIITLTDIVNGVSLDENNREVHDIIHPVIAKKIERKKRELREKYDVVGNELLFKPKSKREAIKKYEEAEYEYLQSLGYEYVYDAVILYITDTNREINNYMEKTLTKQIKEKHLQHAYEKAISREGDYIDTLLEQFGGRPKPAHTLGDKPTQQEWITFEKHNRTYADKYKESLKTIQNVEEEATA